MHTTFMILNIHNLRLVLQFHSTQSSRHLLIEGPQKVRKCSPEFKSRAPTVSSQHCLSTWPLLSVTTFLLAHPSTLAGSCWVAALPFLVLTSAHPSLRSPANFMSEHSITFSRSLTKMFNRTVFRTHILI